MFTQSTHIVATRRGFPHVVTPATSYIIISSFVIINSGVLDVCACICIIFICDFFGIIRCCWIGILKARPEWCQTMLEMEYKNDSV